MDSITKADELEYIEGDGLDKRETLQAELLPSGAPPSEIAKHPLYLGLTTSIGWHKSLFYLLAAVIVYQRELIWGNYTIVDFISVKAYPHIEEFGHIEHILDDVRVCIDVEDDMVKVNST